MAYYLCTGGLSKASDLKWILISKLLDLINSLQGS